MGDVQKHTSTNTIFVTHAYKYTFEFGILYMHTRWQTSTTWDVKQLDPFIPIQAVALISHQTW